MFQHLDSGIQVMHTFVKHVDFLRLKLLVDGMCIVMVTLLLVVEDVEHLLERVCLVFLLGIFIHIVDVDKR